MPKCLTYVINTDDKTMVIYLHGGPFFNIETPLDDPFASFFFKKRNLILLNYPFKKGIGGMDDFKYLYDAFVRLKIKFPKYKFYLVGESYGAYLSSLFSQFNFFEKIICISGFVSIIYQQLFSSEREWLAQYLNPNAVDLLYLAQKNVINTPIYLINGDKDLTTPWLQLETLNLLNNKNVKIYVLNGFRHRENKKKLDKVITLVQSILSRY